MGDDPGASLPGNGEVSSPALESWGDVSPQILENDIVHGNKCIAKLSAPHAAMIQ